MKLYVADTHALFWYLTASTRLSAKAKAAFDEGAQGGALIYVPTIVLAELYYLNQNLGADAHVAATQAIDAGIERGLDAVRQLDAVVRNKFRGDPAALAAWTSASHTERPPRREKKTTLPATPAT